MTTTIATHNGDFHTDDVFAVATLLLALGDAADVRIIRTRDQSLIATAQYVVDVGGVYDPLTERFDHHQFGGAGERSNGIPYAAFGLVWKAHGQQLCANEEIAQKIDFKLVQSVDAGDNGVSLSQPMYANVHQYALHDITNTFIPTWKSTEDVDAAFLEAVKFAQLILLREIAQAKDIQEAATLVTQKYEATEDKRIIILDHKYPWQETLAPYAEPLFVIYPSRDESIWYAKGVRKNANSFEMRKLFPSTWAGKRDDELSAATGVSDALFCHNKLFVATARTQEGAMALARLALEA